MVWEDGKQRAVDVRREIFHLRPRAGPGALEGGARPGVQNFGGDFAAQPRAGVI